MATTVLRTFCRKVVETASLSRPTRIYSRKRVNQVVTSNQCGVRDASSWPGVEESEAEFKWVDRILPKLTVPDPPKHEKYPTPSGWVPPSDKSLNLPYNIRRTRFHHLPVYIVIRDGGVRKLTVVRKVEGNIWAFEAALKEALEKADGSKVYTAVDEVCCKVWVRGEKLRAVTKFLVDKGF